MKSTAFCPISNKKIDEHVARLNGAFTILFLSVFILTGKIFPILFLFSDFALRAGSFSRFSPIAYLSKNIVKVFSLKPVLINSGHKIFAVRIGLIFNIAILLFYFLGQYSVSLVFTGVLATCAFLESVFGICVACQIYPFVYKFTYHAKVQNLKL